MRHVSSHKPATQTHGISVQCIRQTGSSAIYMGFAIQKIQKRCLSILIFYLLDYFLVHSTISICSVEYPASCIHLQNFSITGELFYSSIWLILFTIQQLQLFMLYFKCDDFITLLNTLKFHSEHTAGNMAHKENYHILVNLQSNLIV